MKTHFYGVRTVRGAEHLAVPGLRPAPPTVPKPKRVRSPRKKKPVAANVVGQELFDGAGVAAAQDPAAGVQPHELDSVALEPADTVRFFDLAEDEQERS